MADDLPALVLAHRVDIRRLVPFRLLGGLEPLELVDVRGSAPLRGCGPAGSPEPASCELPSRRRIDLPDSRRSAIPRATIPPVPRAPRHLRLRGRAASGCNWLKSDQDYGVNSKSHEREAKRWRITRTTYWWRPIGSPTTSSDDDIRIVEVDENPALYAEAHIPGAIGFDWKTDLQDQVKRDFLGPEEFGKLMGSRGISNDHTVLLYGDRNNWFAAYTYWYFRYYGHDKVKLINGPREKWIAEDRPTSTDLPSHPEATFKAKEGDEAIRAKRDEVLNALDVGYEPGRCPQPAGVLRRADRDGRLRAGGRPALRPHPGSRFGALGPGRERGRDLQVSGRAARALPGQGRDRGRKPIIAYCRIGERSAHTWFVLHELLGEGNVKNYDGSWTEWGTSSTSRSRRTSETIGDGAVGPPDRPNRSGGRRGT